MKVIDKRMLGLFDSNFHLFASFLFIALTCTLAWFLDANHPIVFIVIGFLGGDIYRTFKRKIE